jgi:Tol biopolymer transport system component
VTLAGQTGFGGAFNPAHPISSNGSHIYFETLGHGGTQQVFVRIGGQTTQEVSASQRNPAATAHPSRLQFASNDGVLAFITSSELLTEDATTGEIGEDLYRYDVGTEQLTDLTVDPAEEGEGGARVQGVLGGSTDGSRIYFVAQGVLATGATAGENNLYLWTQGQGIEFIATGTTSSAFVNNWSPSNRASRVTPDGMHLAFTADNSLTGYPNEGRPEIYLFDAGSGQLVCASCHPGGVPALLGAAIEGRTENIGLLSRNLSNDGRFVFFNTNEALVPRDINNGEDAYEYDSATGQISLISTGTSTQGEMFTDASPSGRDALILSRKQLVGIDQDENVDSYDARIEGGIAAQNPGPPAPPCSSTGECREVGVLPPPPVPGSSNLFGPGTLKPKKQSSCNAKKKRAHGRPARVHRKKAKKCKRASRRAGR